MNDETPRTSGEKLQLSPARIAVWIVVSAVGVFLLVSGIVGIIAKG
ncbi:MAG TPA: hypothetical protein VNS80_04585 [Pseudolysinimonas sp.]|nr:hypothetical protein [Pseudolysinimonas sp.]